ncbi:hypothetical protein HK101_007803 [Irineochytrium annulatum]|nr:hypothetical protein HK101_007803 [Irineochytrium annulatum]
MLAFLPAVAAFLVWAAIMALSTASLLIIAARYKRLPESKSARLPASQVPGVSILRPLKGVDTNLRENLASSFRLDYPRFELIFSVASEKDPAIEVLIFARSYFNEIPPGESVVGVNPKINNLVRGYDTSKFDIVWILDSNVFVNEGILGRSVDLICLPRVGLVHHIPIGVRPNGFGSMVERAFLNTIHAKLYITINKAAITSCIIGKSNIFRKSSLEAVGGLQRFAQFMSEDNIIGHTIFNQQRRHLMTGDVAVQPLGNLSLLDYFKRRARWTRIRKYTVVGATLFEPFTESIVCGLIGAFAFNNLWDVPSTPFFLAHMALWFAIDLINASTLDPSTLSDVIGFTVSWYVREVTALPVYLYACAGSTVEWRGALFRLKNDGTVEEAAPTTSAVESLKILMGVKKDMAAVDGGNTSSQALERDRVYGHPLVTYARSLRMVCFSAVASVFFGLAFLTELVSGGQRRRSQQQQPMFENGGGGSQEGRGSESAGQEVRPSGEREPLWVHVASLFTKRSLSGQSLALSDVWHSMFVAIGNRVAGGGEAPLNGNGAPIGNLTRKPGDYENTEDSGVRRRTAVM